MKSILTLFALFLFLAPVFAEEPTEKPFNGHDLKGWKFRGGEAKSKWLVGAAVVDSANPAKIVPLPAGTDQRFELVNVGAGVDVYTEAKYGDCVVEVEVMVPKGSNSGIYFMGEYEVQVFDSWGKTDLKYGDMGGIYNTAP